ncbi:phage tail family protein [Streptomyces sp. NPDC047990]|uniref:phage tail family protein n=1 Tax=Streptomyces sp. NPDC047990 TaxID=3365496 RepID=UPI003720E3DF
MPIPAVKIIGDASDHNPTPAAPIPQDWQRTYVSIRGANGGGEEIPLTTFQGKDWPSILMQPGATGLDAPPYELHMDDSPNLDGSIFRDSRAGARQVMLPLFLYGIDRRSILTLKRKLVTSLNPKNGYCVLKFVESDGSTRYLNAYYAGGMEGNEALDSSGFHWIAYGIQLTAPDPWYYSEAEHAAQWAMGGTSQLIGGAKFLPMQLSEGFPATKAAVIENEGDVEAWPVWTVKGPIRSISFTNDAGRTFGFDAPIDGSNLVAAGRTLTIDTRPGYKTMTDDQGANYFPLLKANPDLWSVSTGDSLVTIDAVAGSGVSSVSMNFTPRFDSY